MRVSFVCSRRSFLFCLCVILAAVLIPVFLQTDALDAAPTLCNEEQRASYLIQLGIPDPGEPANTRTLLIPERFSDVYETYNRLQQSGGFDLKPYAGRTAEQYTYQIDPHTSAHLLICEDRLIGGDFAEADLNGRMWPLTKEFARERGWDTAG